MNSYLEPPAPRIAFENKNLLVALEHADPKSTTATNTSIAANSQNDFTTDPMSPILAYVKNPFGRYLFIDSASIPQNMSLEVFRSDLDEIRLKVELTAPTVSITDLGFAGAVYACGTFANQKLLPRSLEQLPSFFGSKGARLGITYLSNLLDSFEKDYGETTKPVHKIDSKLHRIRLDLQNWLGASVDDLAELLRLSPTTIVNVSKPGHVVRPKTVRKMVVVHSLIFELQRSIGSRSALAWTQTVGRRLLLDGNLNDFEQYVSSKIFPEPASRALKSSYFGAEDAELDTKPLTPLGKAARF